LAKQEAKAAAPVQKKEGARVKKKVARTVHAGIVQVKATFNNTIISITDLAGSLVSWSSAGRMHFRGARKSSGFAATVAATSAAKEAMSLVGMRECEVIITGPGAGRESAARGIAAAGMQISSIRDTTPVPHNGCRPRKRRRV
jgi:small subunit ribosomal protein S11